MLTESGGMSRTRDFATISKPSTIRKCIRPTEMRLHEILFDLIHTSIQATVDYGIAAIAGRLSIRCKRVLIPKFKQTYGESIMDNAKKPSESTESPEKDTLENARSSYQTAIGLWTYQGSLNWSRFRIDTIRDRAGYRYPAKPRTVCALCVKRMAPSYSTTGDV